MTILDPANGNDNKHKHHYESLSALGKNLLFVGLLLSFIFFSFFSFNNQFLLNAHARSDSDDCSKKDSNIIVGTRPITLGTKCNDVIIACPSTVSASGLGSACGNGDIVRGFENDDVIQGSVGNDELYGGAGNDVIIGGKGVNFFDCGDGNDIIIDFDPDKGDTQSGNCEVILNNHGDMNIFTQPNKIQSQLEAFGIGSSKEEIDINDLGKIID